jgi:hypothetical protein
MNLIKKLLLKVKLTLSLFLDQNAKPKTCRNVLIFRVFGNRTCRGRATAIFQKEKEKTIPVRKFFFFIFIQDGKKKECRNRKLTNKNKNKKRKGKKSR